MWSALAAWFEKSFSAMTAYEILSVIVTALGVLLLYQQLRLIRRQVTDARESIDLSRESAEKRE
jgi:hypothetical protein